MRIHSQQVLGVPIDPRAGAGRDPHERLSAFVEQSTVFALVKGTPNQPMCGFSDGVMRILNTLGAPYATFNVLADPEIRSGAKTWDANGGWPTFPQIYVGGEFVGGFDIVEELYQKGELQDLVREAVEAKGPGPVHGDESDVPTEDTSGHPTPASSIDVPESARASGDGVEDVQEISPKKVNLMGKDHFVLLDVRETDEYEHTHIEGAQLVPMPTIGERVDDLPKDANILCICRSGGRSRRVADFLVSRGFRHVFNLTGGTNAWSEQVDDSVLKY